MSNLWGLCSSNMRYNLNHRVSKAKLQDKHPLNKEMYSHWRECDQYLQFLDSSTTDLLFSISHSVFIDQRRKKVMKTSYLWQFGLFSYFHCFRAIDGKLPSKYFVPNIPPVFYQKACMDIFQIDKWNEKLCPSM